MTEEHPTPLRRRRRVIGLAAALAAASLFCAPAPNATAADAGGIGLRPAHVDESDPATRAYFKPTVAPGGTYTDQIIVSNSAAAAADLLVSGVDGLTAQTSGAVYANRQDPVQKAGAWVTPAVGTLTVAPHSEQALSFTVRVPQDARPGDHLAGIAFEGAHPKTSGGNFAITEVVRAVMGVQIQVPGAGQLHIHIDDVGLQSLPGTGFASVIVKLGNDGLRLGKPGLTVALAGPNGYRKSVDRQLDTILPGDTVDYPLAWPDALQPGDYTITANATGTGTSATHSGSAHLDVALAGAPGPGGAVSPVASPPKGSKGGIPSWVLVVIVAVIGIGGGIAIGRRGRAGGPAKAGLQPGNEPALRREDSANFPADRS